MRVWINIVNVELIMYHYVLSGFNSSACPSVRMCGFCSDDVVILNLLTFFTQTGLKI